MDKIYIQFIGELKQNIIQSRYIATRLANREQLLLYFKTGKGLSEKVVSEKWGARILEQIAVDLQNQLPGLKGFSHRNLKNMRQFFETYVGSPIGECLSGLITFPSGSLIRQSPTAQIESMLKNEAKEVIRGFLDISFTHHILLLNKCKHIEERIFYIDQTANQFWSVALSEHHINSKLFQHQGKLASNFREK